MSLRILMLVTMIYLPVLSACSTTLPAVRLDIPKVPVNPPDSALELCPAHLQTLPTDRAVEQSEGWQIMVSWAEDYHACKIKHAYLAGWVAGQVTETVPVQTPKRKRRWFGF